MISQVYICRKKKSWVLKDCLGDKFTDWLHKPIVVHEQKQYINEVPSEFHRDVGNF